jgi:pyruvate carboxylase
LILLFQCIGINFPGLADEWDAVKEAYAAANRALGNIVKVTPSSKVVGDLANFMVSNSLNELTLVERAEELSFPKSVIEFMQARSLTRDSNSAPHRCVYVLLSNVATYQVELEWY